MTPWWGALTGQAEALTPAVQQGAPTDPMVWLGPLLISALLCLALWIGQRVNQQVLDSLVQRDEALVAVLNELVALHAPPSAEIPKAEVQIGKALIETPPTDEDAVDWSAATQRLAEALEADSRAAGGRPLSKAEAKALADEMMGNFMTGG